MGVGPGAREWGWGWRGRGGGGGEAEGWGGGIGALTGRIVIENYRRFVRNCFTLARNVISWFSLLHCGERRVAGVSKTANTLS